MENSNRTIKVIGALAAGTLAGAALGMLFSPEKGCNIRNKLLGKTKREEEKLIKQMKEDVIAFRTRADQLEKVLSNNLRKIEK